jgi:glycine betaine/proline transport system substrate-binding protein
MLTRRARLLFVLTGAVAMAIAAASRAAEPQQCKTVHFSDVGWSCITATTAIASNILEGLGYEPKSTVLSVPVTFNGLANGDIDAFLGLWLPTQESMIKPYFNKGTIDQVTTNLEGAKYTLAVPKYVYDAGVKSFGDLQKYADKFNHKIYGIEPGNDGNQIIQGMIDKNAFGLGNWELVQSSEQGMLTQVKRAVRGKDWIVFLGWEPHPMNRRFDMAYLSGGDDYFGPNYGGATVHTLAHEGYTQTCPNVGRLLKNMTFDLDLENEMMGYMLDDGMAPEAAARKVLKEHPDLLKQWLQGVTTFDGKPGLPAVQAYLNM